MAEDSSVVFETQESKESRRDNVQNFPSHKYDEKLEESPRFIGSRASVQVFDKKRVSVMQSGESSVEQQHLLK